MRPIKVFHQSKGAIHMSLEILEEKEAIREVIDRFSNLECDVPAQKVSPKPSKPPTT